MEIRPAREEDVPAILDLYNDIILTSAAVWTEEPLTLANRMEWFRSRRAKGFPILAACEGAELAGFSTFGEFRQSFCYWPCVELTVHVQRAYRGRGIGKKLVQALFPYAEAMGKHVLIAGIEASNEASVRLHKSLGFEQVAHLREIGFKFDRRLDLLFLQRFVGPPQEQKE